MFVHLCCCCAAAVGNRAASGVTSLRTANTFLHAEYAGGNIIIIIIIITYLCAALSLHGTINSTSHATGNARLQSIGIDISVAHYSSHKMQAYIHTQLYFTTHVVAKKTLNIHN